MQLQYLLAAWAAVAYIIYRFVASYIRERENAHKAKELGCGRLQQQPNKRPFGIEHTGEVLTADRRKLFPDYLIERYRRHGNRTFACHILGNHAISTNEPKNVQAILATQFKDFGLGERRRAWLTPLMGVGIFTADGKEWEHSRAMMRPQFNREQISDLQLEEQHVQNLMRAMRPSPATRWTPEVDLQVLFFRLTLDSACEFLFGESVDSQVRNLPENANLPPKHGNAATTDEATFAGAFDRGQAWLSRRSRFGELYWLVDGPGYRKDKKAVHQFVDHFVRIALSKRKDSDFAAAAPRRVSTTEIEKGPPSPTTGRRSSTGKEKYVFLEALAAQTQDPIELRSQLLNILLAGRDTTASLLGWTFYLLARHPKIWTKLRGAILSDFGNYSNGTSKKSFASLKNCTYLQHVLAEVLRLYPVVPVNLREAVKDTTLPVGGGEDGSKPVFVPKGTQVDYSVHVMHRLPHLWGEDADEFRPERWVGRKPGWEYLPFNGGPRICLGREFYSFFFDLFTLREIFCEGKSLDGC